MALTPDEALRMFADAPPPQLFIDVDPDDWTEAYLAELASGGPSTVNANGRTIACRTVRVDHDEHRVWLEPIGDDNTDPRSSTAWASEAGAQRTSCERDRCSIARWA